MKVTAFEINHDLVDVANIDLLQLTNLVYFDWFYFEIMFCKATLN